MTSRRECNITICFETLCMLKTSKQRCFFTFQTKTTTIVMMMWNWLLWKAIGGLICHGMSYGFNKEIREIYELGTVALVWKEGERGKERKCEPENVKAGEISGERNMKGTFCLFQQTTNILLQQISKQNLNKNSRTILHWLIYQMLVWHSNQKITEDITVIFM